MVPIARAADAVTRSTREGNFTIFAARFPPSPFSRHHFNMPPAISRPLLFAELANNTLTIIVNIAVAACPAFHRARAQSK